jgi:hypothetical protein
MRDPRFEPAQIEIVGGCTAGLPSTLRATVLPAPEGTKTEALALDIDRIDKSERNAGGKPIHLEAPRPTGSDTRVDLPLPALSAGGYSARLRVGSGPATRRDFACEAGGDEWADSRPDADRLKALAAATGGIFAWADDASLSLPLPKPTVVSAERHVVPVAPPWVWTLLAAAALGAHWFTRRRSGLA